MPFWRSDAPNGANNAQDHSVRRRRRIVALAGDAFLCGPKAIMQVHWAGTAKFTELD